MAKDLEKSGVKVKSPSALAHVVLRTNNFRPMIDFYVDFLGATITHQDEKIAFLRYDFEHHRVAIIKVPGLGPKVPKSNGLDHFSFTFDTLDDLVEAYTQRKALGILPRWCTNHGPTTSIYYNDPDGNGIETQVDNFDTPEAANEFMSSEFFEQNSIGSDFDPEELIRRLRSGESHASIKKRIEIGERGLPEGY